jgi:RNA polymerase sigma-70 factor, ECF subfamily
MIPIRGGGTPLQTARQGLPYGTDANSPAAGRSRSIAYRKGGLLCVILLNVDGPDVSSPTMMLKDRYLVWQLKRSSEQALCRIYSLYETDLLTLATSLLGRADQAQDVLQDVFLGFIESIDDFELTGSLKGYLATCIANRARDYLRRGRCRSSEPLEMAGLVESRHVGPLQAAIVGEQQQRLMAALEELPCEQRETILLHLQTGLKFREIAALQRISAKTVESRYRYGINRLRSMLNDQVGT